MVGVVEPEQRQERLALREVQAGDRDEPVGGLEAAVVRVHRQAGGDLVGPRVEVQRSARTTLAASVSPASQTRSCSCTASAAASSETSTSSPSPVSRARTSAARTPRREEEARGEVGHRDPAGAHRDAVPARSVRGQEAGARLRDEVVGRSARERPVRPERRDAPDDKRRMRRVDAPPVEPERAARSGGKLCTTTSADARSCELVAAPRRSSGRARRSACRG